MLFSVKLLKVIYAHLNFFVSIKKSYLIIGMEIVKKIEGTKTNGRDAPILPVKIANCGELQVEEPFAV